MRTFSTLVAIVALSIFSVHAAPVQHDNNDHHPHKPEHHCPRSVIRTNAIPRDVDDTAHHVPAHHVPAHHVPGNVHNIAARADDKDPAKNIPKADTTPGHRHRNVPRVDRKGDADRAGARPGSLKDVIPRAGGDDTKSDHHGGRGAHHGIPGKEDSVVPRDSDEPPCDGEGRGSGKGEHTH
ncbi:hypothetical protein JOM56_009786 [Amanita muscaria]